MCCMSLGHTARAIEKLLHIKQINLPAPNITEGLLVFVQLVMAAITTEP